MKNTIIILFLLIVNNLCISAHDKSENRFVKISKIKPEISTKAEILDQKITSHDGIDLRIRLSLTNTGTQPILIYKKYFEVSKIVMSNDINALEKRKYVLDDEAFLMLNFMQMDFPFPPPDLFITLKPNESYVTETATFISCDWNKIKAENDYYIKFLVETWGGQYSLGKKLKNKWADFGKLQLDSLITEPSRITFSQVLLKDLQN